LFLRPNDHRCSRAAIASAPSFPAEGLEDITCLCNNWRSLSSTQGRAREDIVWAPREIKIKNIYRKSSHEPARDLGEAGAAQAYARPDPT